MAECGNGGKERKRRFRVLVPRVRTSPSGSPVIKKQHKRWAEREREVLKCVVEKAGGKENADWGKVANDVSSLLKENRSRKSCYSTYHRMSESEEPIPECVIVMVDKSTQTEEIDHSNVPNRGLLRRLLVICYTDEACEQLNTILLLLVYTFSACACYTI